MMFVIYKMVIDYLCFLVVDIICMYVYSELIVNFKIQDINCVYGVKNLLYVGLGVYLRGGLMGEFFKIDK